jgi:hypothetical protein
VGPKGVNSRRSAERLKSAKKEESAVKKEGDAMALARGKGSIAEKLC